MSDWKPEAGEKCRYHYLRGETECSGECAIEARSGGKIWFKPTNAQDVVRLEADTLMDISPASSGEIIK